MHEKIITYASPIFFLLIGIELLIAYWLRRRVYHTQDAISSLGLGILSQVVGVFTQIFNIGVFAWTSAHLALWQLPSDNWLVWVAALIGYDLCYYWNHRIEHEISVLWGGHVVHHQSEDYNLSTALRQSPTAFLFSWIFYLPLAVAGVPLTVFAVVALIDLLYQFWIHTELIGSHRLLDRIFATPSNHRVHHAVNDRYIDRNYGGVLIIWDRLFGTFQEELPDEPCVYGTRAPLRSFNPLWASLEVYVALARDAWHAASWRDKLAVWVKRPGWRPQDAAQRHPKPAFNIERARYAPVLGGLLTLYCLVQFGAVILLAVHFLDFQAHAGAPEVLAYAFYLVVALCLIGMLSEGDLRALPWEGLRVAFTAVVPLLSGQWFGFPDLPVAAGIGFLVFFGAMGALLVLAARAQRAAGQIVSAQPG